MPIISTIAGASLAANLKEKDTSNSSTMHCRCCCCCCRHFHCHHEFHQEQTGTIPGKMPGTEKENSAEWLYRAKETLWQRQWEQQQQQQERRKADVMKRAPFRSLNGKAYAVPLKIVREFDAMLQRTQGSARPENRDAAFFLLSSPGVLWRHDPYSTKVLSANTFSQRKQPITRNNKELVVCLGDGGNGSSRGNKMNISVTVKEDKDEAWGATALMPEVGEYLPTVYGSTTMSPMCMFNPVSPPFGSMPCFHVYGGVCSADIHPLFQQMQDNTIQVCGHFTDFDEKNAITAAVVNGEQLQNREVATSVVSVPGPMIPSARPLPATPGRCVVIRSALQPSSAPSVSTPVITPTTTTTTTAAAAKGANETTKASRQRDGLNYASVEDNSAPSVHRPRSSLSEGTDHSGDGKPDNLPSTLRMFQTIPPLFTDLAAYTNRRPSFLKNKGKGGDDDNNQLRSEDMQYIYLVQHRCRRTVSAARVRHELNEMVVLEGDMGIEMGSVQAVLSMEEFDRLGGTQLAQRGFPTGCEVVTAALILRTATDEEMAHYNHTLRYLAKDLLSFLQCRLNPANFVDCQVEHMEFLDCEFQADCKKVYVYYRARKRVLFRELAQYLHSFYHCRIWLHEVGRGASMVSGDSSQETAN